VGNGRGPTGKFSNRGSTEAKRRGEPRWLPAPDVRGLHPPWPGGIAMTAAVVEVTSGSVSPVAMEAILSYCGVCRQIATAAAGALSSALGVQLGSTSASRVPTQS
jgi:hypothetical protein